MRQRGPHRRAARGAPVWGHADREQGREVEPAGGLGVPILCSRTSERTDSRESSDGSAANFKRLNGDAATHRFASLTPSSVG
jgi:hypothetical protein